jgi:hypothetical protein
MSDWLAGELSMDNQASLEAHQATCDGCRKELDRLLLQDRAIEELVGQSLARSLEDRVREALKSSPKKRRKSAFGWMVAAAAVAAVLLVGAALWLAGPSELPGVATIERVRGKVMISGPAGEATAAEGVSLPSGSGIRTLGPVSLAVLQFTDGSELELGGNTTVSVLEETAAGKRVAVSEGTLRASVVHQPAGHPMTLTSSQARATVLGTRLRLVVDRGNQGPTRLEVEEGKVRLARTQDGQAVEVSTGTYAVAAPGAPLVARPLLPSGKMTVVKAGETLTLSEDLVLSGEDVLDIQGTGERRCVLLGNRHQIRTTGEWAGRVHIGHCEIRELGDRVVFNAQGRVTSEAHAIELGASKAADIAIEESVFLASSSVRLRLDGQSTVRFVNNVSREDSVVSVDKAREKSFPFFEATGNSSASKVFQGNRIYRAYVNITGPRWTIGGDTDRESNLIIGLRAALNAYGEGTVVRGNYIHLLMPLSEEYPYWSQVSTFTTAKGALAEQNVIRDGEWIVQFVEGEFRYNLICDINDHDLLRNGSTGRIHHNIFVAGRPDHRAGQMSGCIFIVYAPKEGEQGAEIFNNTFDAGGTMNVPGIEVNPGGLVKSLRNNVFFNFAHGEKYIKSAQAMIRPTWSEDLTVPPPVRLGYSDYNLFYSPLAKVKKNYALAVAGKTERKDAGFGLNDVPRGGSPNDQVDPKFKGPIPTAFAFFDDDIRSGKVTVSNILAFYRNVYTPAPGSPLLGAGDPADGEGTNIGAVDVATPPRSNPK